MGILIFCKQTVSIAFKRCQDFVLVCKIKYKQGADTSLKTADNAYNRIFARSLPQNPII